MKALIMLAWTVCALTSWAQPEIHWQKNYGGTSGDGGVIIASTTDGGYIVLGRTISNDGQVSGHHGLDDLWVIKLDGDGDLVWQRCLGGTLMEEPGMIRQVADGGYFVLGSTRSDDGDVEDHIGGKDIWLVRLDEAGAIVWAKCYGGEANDVGTSILEMANGELLVLGSTTSSEMENYQAEQDLVLLHIAGDGELLRQKCFGGSSQDGASAMLLLEDGSILVTGFTVSNDGDVSGNHGSSDGWIVKLAPDWMIEWQRCIGGSSPDNVHALVAGQEATYYVALSTASSDGDISVSYGGVDYFIVHFDLNGEVLNVSSFGGSNTDGPWSMVFGADLGLMVFGVSQSSDGDITSPKGDLDAWLINTSSSLDLTWDRSLGGSGADSGRDMCFAHDGSLIMVGTSSSTDGDLTGNFGSSDVWVVKFEAENVAVPEQDDAGLLVLYPSPANDAVRVTWYKPDVHTLEVFDAQGRLIHSVTGLTKNQRDMVLSVAAWAEGLYTVCLTGEGDKTARRFMKN